MALQQQPFESIENAQEYIHLLAEVVASEKSWISTRLDSPQTAPRTQQALQLVDYKLARLEQHLASTRRILSDLRMLRRLLHGERDTSPHPRR